MKEYWISFEILKLARHGVALTIPINFAVVVLSSILTLPAYTSKSHTKPLFSPTGNCDPRPFPMKVICVYCVLLLLGSLSIHVEGKQNEGYDLDSDAPVRIGVKKRIKDKDCK